MEKYEIERTLGVGACGKAYLAKRKADGLQVSIKEMCIAGNDNAIAESKSEVEILRTLDHKFIIRYFEDFQEKDNFYIVMEFADGGNLADKIKQSPPFCEAEVLNYFTQMLIALQHIHLKHILHRDLKSENIFLMKDGTVKIGDFGVSKALASTVSLAMTQIGTPYYLSPEICKGKNYNSTSDVWSLGIILYELLTKKRPFDAGNLCALISQITTKLPPAIPTHFSPEMHDLVNKLLTKDANQRPNVNQIMNFPVIKGRLVNFLGMTMRGARFESKTMFANEGKATEEESAKIIDDGRKRISHLAPLPPHKSNVDNDERQTLYQTQRLQALENKKKVESGDDVMKQIEAGMKESEARRQEARMTKTPAYRGQKPGGKSAEDVMKEIEAGMKETEFKVNSSRQSKRPSSRMGRPDSGANASRLVSRGKPGGTSGEESQLDQVAADILGALENPNSDQSSGTIGRDEGADQKKALRTLLEKKVGADAVKQLVNCAKKQQDPASLLSKLDKTSVGLAQQLLVLEVS